jgi:mannose-6-phosphate isomerase-like protein (cupin superfamily)
MVTKKDNAECYSWGDGCEGWYLAKSDTLTVIQEIIPPGKSERLHTHQKCQQLFYVLSGEAAMEVDGTVYRLKQQDSIHIKPGQLHKVWNDMSTNLHLLVVSEPESHLDRINHD